MKFLVLLCAVATVARGAHVVAPVGVVSQYHAQDELGQYSYGYSGGPSAKYETRTADGITRGGYSYVDAHGLVQSANYVSDSHNGFRVAATDIPVGPSPPASVPDALPVVRTAAVVPAAVPAVVPAATTYHAVAPAVTAYHAVAPAVTAYHAVAPAVTTYHAVAPAVTTYHAVAPAVHLLGRRKRALYPAYYAPRGFSYSTHVVQPYVAAYPYYSTVHASPIAVHAAPVIGVHARKRRDVSLFASAPAVAYSAVSPVAYSAVSPVAYSAVSPVPYSAVSPVAYSAVSPVAYSAAVPVAHAAIAPVAVASPVAATSQYHAQDSLGQYSYGYAGGPSAKYEAKTADGVTQGGYSYVDAHGLVQSVAYTADAHNGFRVAATNLPVH